MPLVLSIKLSVLLVVEDPKNNLQKSAHQPKIQVAEDVKNVAPPFRLPPSLPCHLVFRATSAILQSAWGREGELYFLGHTSKICRVTWRIGGTIHTEVHDVSPHPRIYTGGKLPFFTSAKGWHERLRQGNEEEAATISYPARIVTSSALRTSS